MTANYWTEREPGELPPAPWIDPRTRREPAMQKLQNLVVMAVALALLGLTIHDRYFNRPAPPPDDHLEANAKAYIRVQPTSLREVAKGIRSGVIPKEKVGEAIRAAHTPAATDLQNSLSSSVSLPDALDRAAAAMEGVLRK